MRAFVNAIQRRPAANASTLLNDLISSWELDEASGNAIDSHGSNTMTQTGTIAAFAGGGRDFEASNTEYFTLTDNASISTGNIDFTFSFWLRVESFVNFMTPIAKDNTTSQREFGLYYTTSNSRWRWYCSPNANGSGLTEVVASNFGAPSLATWHFLVCWHDSVNDQIGIQINDGTANTVAYSAGVADTTSSFYLGGSPFHARYDGVMRRVRFHKRILTSGEKTALYNAGAGISYPF